MVRGDNQETDVVLDGVQCHLFLHKRDWRLTDKMQVLAMDKSGISVKDWLNGFLQTSPANTHTKRLGIAIYSRE